MPDPPTSRLPKVDIDEYLNPLVPHPRWDILPHFISHWFGYRPPGHTPKKRSPQVSSLQVWAFAFLGGFIGISIIENVYRALPQLGGHQVPTVIASFGAAAILEYNAIESPLSQPRNLVFGHFLSALIGVSITKLFQMLPPERFEDLRWLAGALAVGSASAVMGITKTVHPPAGATALLAATTPEMTDLGWWMLPLVLLACTLMLTSAMLVNNLYKRFPIYWWTPVDLKEMRKKADVVEVKDVEKGSSTQADDDSESKSSSQSHSEAGLKKNQGRGDSVSTAPRSEQTAFEMHYEAEKRIVIEEERIVVPDWIELSQFEITALEGIQMRLQQNRAAKA